MHKNMNIVLTVFTGSVNTRQNYWTGTPSSRKWKATQPPEAGRKKGEESFCLLVPPRLFL